MSELQRAITKILVPVDGSVNASKAAQMAIVIAKGVIAKIVVITVVQESSYAMMNPESAYFIDEFFKNVEEEAKENLQHVVDMCIKSKVNVETKIFHSTTSVVDIICRTASDEHCDLIVMGTRGRTGVKRFLLGSVAGGVITYAPCPVLVVR